VEAYEHGVNQPIGRPHLVDDAFVRLLTVREGDCGVRVVPEREGHRAAILVLGAGGAGDQAWGGEQLAGRVADLGPEEPHAARRYVRERPHCDGAVAVALSRQSGERFVAAIGPVRAERLQAQLAVLVRLLAPGT
jgi:hypothetical protein